MNIFKFTRFVTIGLLAMSGCAVDTEEPAENGAPNTPGQPELAVSSASQRHCVLNADANELKCYSEFPEAVAAATGGRITDAPLSAKAALDDQAFSQRINALSAASAALTAGATTYSSIVVGIFYEHDQYNGATLTVTRGADCTHEVTDVDYTVSYGSLVRLGWTGVISSFHGYSHCWCKLWEGTNCTGSSYGYYEYSSNVGAMNDRTNCITLS